MNPPEVPPEKQNTRHLSIPSEKTEGVPSTTGPLDMQRPWVIEFRVVGTASTVKARVSDSMIMGRSDTASGFNPDVDLSPFDALSKGVSRKHALITVKDQRLMLRDLNSTNGTRINNLPCSPGEEYRLRHGNELTLGTLRLQVSFAVVPAFVDTQHGASLKEAIEPLIHSIGKRVLVVESDPDVGGVFRSALEAVGYRVTLVPDVIKGFGVIFQGMPDVVVLDLMEPDTNGLDLIRFVRKQRTAQHVPIVAVSAALAGFQMNQALSAGADTFLGKPVSVDALLKTVANAINPPPKPAVELIGAPSETPASADASQMTRPVTEAPKQTAPLSAAELQRLAAAPPIETPKQTSPLTPSEMMRLASQSAQPAAPASVPAAPEVKKAPTPPATEPNRAASSAASVVPPKPSAAPPDAAKPAPAAPISNAAKSSAAPAPTATPAPASVPEKLVKSDIPALSGKDEAKPTPVPVKPDASDAKPVPRTPPRPLNSSS